jgi:cytochrome b subunit of formate dehydrogenase
MPEEIIRTYLVNPYFYGCRSYCGGCQKHVPYRELTWVSTNQSLNEYFQKLKILVPNAGRYRKKAIQLLVTTGTLFGVFLGAITGLIIWLTGPLMFALIAFAVVALVGSIAGYHLLKAIRGGI